MVVTRRQRHQDEKTQDNSKEQNKDAMELSTNKNNLAKKLAIKKASPKEMKIKKRSKKVSKEEVQLDIDDPEPLEEYAAIDEDSDSGSDAPVEMGFDATKDDALAKFKLEKDQIQAEKVKKKKHRQTQQEKFIEQKQEKKKHNALRLPTAVLDNLDESFEPDLDSTSKPEAKKVEVQKTIKRNFNEKSFQHGSTEFKVYNINDEIKKANCASEDAATFRDRMMNRKLIHREPVSKILSVAKKQRIVGSDRHVK